MISLTAKMSYKLRRRLDYPPGRQCNTTLWTRSRLWHLRNRLEFATAFFRTWPLRHEKQWLP